MQHAGTPCMLHIVKPGTIAIWSKWDDLSQWMAGSTDSTSIFCFSEVRDDITFAGVSSVLLMSFNATCCFVTCSQQKLAIVCVHWSPSIPVSIGLDDLGQLLSKVLLISHHVILAGDLNIDMLSTCATSNYQNLLSDIKFNLVQHVINPSRLTELPLL